MKRFLDTEMLIRPWFRGLKPRLKCLWLWMLTRCDMAGVIDMDWELASFAIGEKVSTADLAAMNGNVVATPCGKLLLPGFIPFQYGELNEASRVHQGVLKCLSGHGIGYPFKDLPYPMQTLSRGSDTPKDKDKDKDKEQDKDKAKDSERPRNLIMDAIGAVDGNIAELTPAGWKRAAVALKEIREASPDVTPEQIADRAENYRTYFSGAALTSTALAKHWAKCAEPNTKGTPNATETRATDHRRSRADREYPEPVREPPRF